ncbi:MAG: DUF86 domain-containing protein [Clostridiales bacterium]|nr:DUF86 domain-containing protein [Clostridiales bacterium]
MKNFRNKIIHDYTGISLIIIYEIVKNDLIKLQSQIEEIIKLKIKKVIFDKKEINLSKNSKYYKHVRFEKII